MTTNEPVIRILELLLRYIEVLVWPVVVLWIAFRYREAISSILGNMLPRAKIELSLFGVKIETTLPELEDSTEAVIGGCLSQQQLGFLRAMAKNGKVSFSKGGVPKPDREWIRPLMNAGLIRTEPPEARLGDENTPDLIITPLGGLLIRGMERHSEHA